MDEHFREHFPSLTDVTSKRTSDPDDRYNCIAWAFGDNQRFWWPSPRAYWPMDCTGRTVKQAFEEWLAFDGWLLSDDNSYKSELAKIALYELNGRPTHASRLLPCNLWTSKLGKSLDLAHQLADLEGPLYGMVAGVYQKPTGRTS